MSSVLAAFTGIVQFGSFGSATPTQGSDLALTALVVAVVGGGSLMGGRGSIAGALLAAIVLGMSYTGLVLSGVSTTWFQSFVGFLLLFAVIMNLRTEAFGRAAGSDPQVMTDPQRNGKLFRPARRHEELRQPGRHPRRWSSKSIAARSSG